MIIFVVFIVSLALLALLFTMKGLEVSAGRKIFLANYFFRSDLYLLKIFLKIKLWWGHISFKNTKLFFSWIIATIRKIIVSIKRHFDHKQSHFFTRTKKDHDILKDKGSASFFLKDVADYKKNLRENLGEGDNI